MNTKTCKKRNHTYDASLVRCPECRLINMHEWRERNAESVKEKARIYAIENKEHKNEYNKIYREQHRDKLLEYGRSWRENNPDKLKESLDAYKNWEGYSNSQRSIKLKKYWPGATPKEARAKYDELLTKQNGVCAICKQPEIAKHNTGKLRELSVDHCHDTDKVRGLLCTNCNQGLGKFKDDILRFQSAIEYLNAARAEKEAV